MVKSYTVDFICLSLGLFKIPCTDKLPERTVVMTSCKKGHVKNDYLENMVCIDGRWNSDVPSCKPVCGKPPPALVPSTRGQNVTSPWQVGIYQRDGEIMKQTCAGSLIQSNVVITAARCFWDQTQNQTFPASKYKVAAQKSYRLWDDTNDAITSEVSRILIHELYGGDELNQQGDIALLQLTTPFNLSDSLYPVCYNLYNAYLDEEQTQEGFLAKVFSWGRVETGEPSQNLKSMTFPIVNITECRDEHSKYGYERFLTSDKLCAGYVNGSTALCQGDKGAGLVTQAKIAMGEMRWYILGVVSDGPLSNGTSDCWSTYTSFTQVYKLRKWISSQLNALQ